MNAQVQEDLTGTASTTAAQFHAVVDRNAFLKLLTYAQGVVEKKNTVPILNNVLLEATANQIRLNATDGEMSFEAALEAKVQQPGSITCSAQMIYDIIRKLKDGAEVELKLDPSNDTMEVLSGRSDFKLTCLPAIEFPVLNAGELPHTFAIHAAELGMLLDRTHFSMAMEETRYYLNGVFVHATDSGQLRAAATDGHRLAQVEIPVPQGAENIPGVIISRKTVNQVRKLVEESADEVQISLSNNQILFKFANGFLTSRLIDGKYPDYERVVPANNTKTLEVDAGVLNEAVDRVAIFATDKEPLIKLTLQPNLLQIKAFSSGSGSADEDIEVAYDGDAMEFGFNYRYLMDITQAFQGQTLKFELGNSGDPVIIRLLGDVSSLFVLMPLRV